MPILAVNRREPPSQKNISQNPTRNLTKNNSQSAKFDEDERHGRHAPHLRKAVPIDSAIRVQRATVSTMFFLLLIFAHLASSAPQWGHIQRTEREELAYEWAPLVWLHPNERFYPSSVTDFLQHVKPSKPGRGNALHIVEDGSKITLPPLPNGRASWDAYLLASYNTECHNCPLPKHLFGKKPGRKYSPPVYAVIHSCDYPQPKINPNDSENGHHLLLNDDIHYSQPVLSAAESSRKHESSSDNNAGNQNYHGKDELVRFSPTESNIPSTDSNWNPITQPQSNANQSEVEMHQHSTNKSSHVQSTISVSGFHRQNLQGSGINNYMNLSSDSRSTMTTTINPDYPSTVTYKGNFTNQTKNNSTHHSDHLQAENIQNDQGVLSQQNTIPDPDEDVLLKIFTKEKKRDVINSSNQQFSVTYWMFYPYNYAKDICTSNLGFFGRILKPMINGVCHGEKIPMGNHFGDWEHITIQFKGRTPTKMYVSSHNFGAYYTYDSHRHWFHYTSQDTREGLPLSPDYPLVLQMRGTHPVLYSALGSHGLWAAPGIHQYNSFPLLEDKTAEGTAWKTWQNLEIMDLKYQESLSTEQRYWLSYEGRWGNPSNRCHALMGGFCELNHGPTGIPRKRINFPCQR